MQEESLKGNGVEVTTDPKDDYDVVHINTIFPSDYFMAKKAKKCGKKVVYHAHSTKEDFQNSFTGSNLIAPLFKKWIMKCYQTGDLILTPTNYSKSLLEGYGIKNQIEVISNGVDTTLFQKNMLVREKFRNKYGFKNTDKIVMSVGLYFERKGILDFVELAKQMPEYQFVWFGYTPDSQIPKKIREAVHTKLPNLKFTGYLPKEELQMAYSSCDLFSSHLMRRQRELSCWRHWRPRFRYCFVIFRFTVTGWKKIEMSIREEIIRNSKSGLKKFWKERFRR